MKDKERITRNQKRKRHVMVKKTISKITGKMSVLLGLILKQVD